MTPEKALTLEFNYVVTYSLNDYAELRKIVFIPTGETEKLFPGKAHVTAEELSRLPIDKTLTTYASSLRWMAETNHSGPIANKVRFTNEAGEIREFATTDFDRYDGRAPGRDGCDLC